MSSTTLSSPAEFTHLDAAGADMNGRRVYTGLHRRHSLTFCL